jgi:hypothetical protein
VINAFKEDVKATYVFESGTSIEIDAVYSERAEEIETQHETKIASSKLRLYVRLSDLTEQYGEGDKVTVRSVTYSVYNPQEDGDGGVEFTLHEG